MWKPILPLHTENVEKQSHGRYGKKIWRFCSAALYPLLFAIRDIALAENGKSGTYGRQCADEFEISNEDMETLKYAEKIKNYGDFSMFPVFGGKMAADGICSPQDFPHKK